MTEHLPATYTWDGLDPQARALLSAHGGEQAIVVFPRVIASVGLGPAVLLSFLIARSRAEAGEDGWFALREEDLRSATGLTRHVYLSARRELEQLGACAHEARGVPPVTRFRVDLGACAALLVSAGNRRIDAPETGELGAGIRRIDSPESGELGAGIPIIGEPANQSSGIRRIDADGPATRRIRRISDSPETGESRARARAGIPTSKKEKEEELVVPVYEKEPVQSPEGGAGGGPDPVRHLEEAANAVPESPSPETGDAPPTPLPPPPAAAAEALAARVLERAEARVHAMAAKPEPLRVANGWEADELERMTEIFRTGTNPRTGRVVAEGGYPSRRAGDRLLRPARGDYAAIASVPRARATDLLRALKAYAASWRARPDEERQYVKTLRRWLEDGTWEDWATAEVVQKAPPKWEPVRTVDGHPNPYDLLKAMPTITLEEIEAREKARAS